MIDLRLGRPNETDAGGHTPALAALTNTMVKPANGPARRFPCHSQAPPPRSLPSAPEASGSRHVFAQDRTAPRE
jgi:hypothetical protein